ncbi:hypothetical protein M9458_021756, partial [Cirrhinus mrigala]
KGNEDAQIRNEKHPRPQLADPAAPPWLLAPSSLSWPGSPLAPPVFLVPPAPPWLVVNHPTPQDSTPPALTHPSVHPAPSGSSIPSAPPWSFVASSTSALRILLITLAHRLSVSTLGTSATCSATSALPPQWLLPPLAPPLVVIMAVAWIPPTFFCSKSLLSLSGLPWLLLSLPFDSVCQPPPKCPSSS